VKTKPTKNSHIEINGLDGKSCDIYNVKTPYYKIWVKPKGPQGAIIPDIPSPTNVVIPKEKIAETCKIFQNEGYELVESRPVCIGPITDVCPTEFNDGSVKHASLTISNQDNSKHNSDLVQKYSSDFNQINPSPRLENKKNLDPYYRLKLRHKDGGLHQVGTLKIKEVMLWGKIKKRFVIESKRYDIRCLNPNYFFGKFFNLN